MNSIEYYFSKENENEKIIIVYERYPRLKTKCFSLECNCSCGDMCDFEDNETIHSVYPFAKEIDRNQVIEILKKHNCKNAIEHLETFLKE